MNYSYAQLEAIWLQAAQGTSYETQYWAALMAAIALAESSGDPNSKNATDNNGTQTSWGLWQISLGNHNAPSPNWNDPVTNAQLAIGKLNSQGLGAWGTYDTGAYLKYYNTGTQPAGNVPSNTGSPGSAGNPASLTSSLSDLLKNPLNSLSAGGIGAQLASTFGAGNVRDMFVRLGFILLGAALLITGLVIMAGKPVSQVFAAAAPAPVKGAGRAVARTEE